MNRVFNFSAGPSVLPEEVLKQAQEQMLCYKDSGMSVMEMSHRSKVYQEIFDTAQSLFKQLLNISDDYEVLFLQGGATTQFSAVPMNLSGGKKCLYIDSGAFASKAIKEAKRYADVSVIASSKADNYSYVPTEYEIDQDAAYLHITSNNTIFGTSYPSLPKTGKVALVADMSSEICGVERDISKFGLVYAGAQKNIGPAGLTVVIIKKSLLENPLGITPLMLNYSELAKTGSMLNTPCTYAIYIAMLNFEYMLRNGGVKGAHQRNKEKAALVYDALDSSSFYTPVAKKEFRSIMNVTFTLPNEELTQKFVSEAGSIGLVNIKGHRSVGGIRASMYNAMPKEGAEKLAQFMADFERKN
ncbi:MAG: 3-phosphoserine/phosphohydroxythreonine transaminase [Clostridia bacterium]|nr:3-phosphoserine/phosphohydroxythreonine transaminase [Clostridia bacterium]